MKDIDLAWNRFINDGILNIEKKKKNNNVSPKCGHIYISTKTKIAYISEKINLNEIFWKINITPYFKQKEGVIKKQIKMVCLSEKETLELNEKIKKENHNYLNIQIIKSINNPNAKRVKYKYVKKINIGLSKKDIISLRTKKKGAFYNCIVLIIRLKINKIFKEFHIKIFNTGKLEIPGIKYDSSLVLLLNKLISILQPFYKNKIIWKPEDIDTVLINSNFNCGFYLDRIKLYKILKYKYNIQVVFDSCSYPGIQCKFYYNTKNEQNNGRCNCEKQCNKKEKKKNQCVGVSFMIFRTGSVLIVGRCTEKILNFIYKYIKEILITEYSKIKINYEHIEKTKKKKNPKKKIILK